MGAEFCDACAQLRMASTLECIDACPEGLDQRNGYCYNSTLPENSCEAMAPEAEDSMAVAVRPLHFYTMLTLVLAAALTANHY